MPIPHSRIEITVQHDEGSSSVVEGTLRPLDIRSRLRSDELGVRWAVQESLQRKLSVGILRSWRRNTTTLLGEPFSFTPFEPDGISRVAAWRLWQQASLRSPDQLVALRSTFTTARNNLQDIPGLPAEIGASPPHAYTYWQGQGQYVRQLSEGGVQLVLRTAVQASAKPLVPLDRFSIGGAASVRGFRENTLVRDRGAVANLELEYPMAWPPFAGARLTLVPFFDYGRGANVRAASDTLSSVGVAARVRWQGFSGELAFGHKLARPASFVASHRTLQDRGIHFQVSYSPP
jgi:hemolysin activation/secretion protein